MQRGGPEEVQVFPLRLDAIIMQGKPLLRVVANDMLYFGCSRLSIRPHSLSQHPCCHSFIYRVVQELRMTCPPLFHAEANVLEVVCAYMCVCMYVFKHWVRHMEILDSLAVGRG